MCAIRFFIWMENFSFLSYFFDMLFIEPYHSLRIIYKTSSFWISSFSCSKLLCVVVWYCKTKLNPGTENQRKPFHVVQKKKKEVFLNFCSIPVCSVAWLRGPVFIFHLKISMTAISTLFWHQILKRLLNNLRRRKITLAKFFFLQWNILKLDYVWDIFTSRLSCPNWAVIGNP